MQIHILILFIKKYTMRAKLDELQDWKTEGCSIVVSGDLEQRPDDGFIILNWDHPIPDTFRKKFEVDTDIIDHIGLSIHTTLATIVQPEA